MELLFVSILTLITLFTVSSVFLRSCRAITFPAGHSSAIVRFTPPFLAGVTVIVLEAVLILSQLEGQRLANSFVWATRSFALANGLLWGLLNVRRPMKPLTVFFLPISWILFTCLMLLPLLRILQIFLFVWVIIIPPWVWPLYGVVWVMLYLGVAKGKFSGALANIFRKDREEIDLFIGTNRGLFRTIVILLLLVPVLLWIGFYSGAYFEWIALPGVH